MLENTGQKTNLKNTKITKTKHNLEKANNTKQQTKLPWFSRFSRHSTSKQGGLTGFQNNAPKPTAGTMLFISISQVILAVKTASEMTYIVLGRALNSTPTPIQNSHPGKVSVYSNSFL